MNSLNFTIILLCLAVITGFIWFIDVLFLKHQRTLRVISSGPFAKGAKEPILVENAKAFFPMFIIVLILRSFVAEPYRIPSGSMRPTLLEGDFIVVNKFDYGLKVPIIDIKILPFGQPKRGDVVVFFNHEKQQNMIKRVIGLPHDHVKVDNNQLFINSVPLPQEFLREVDDIDESGILHRVKLIKEETDSAAHQIYVRTTESIVGKYNDYTVPADCYFVMGDNRSNSADSRYIGCIAEKDILGRAFAIWFSFDSATTDWSQKLRWHRMGLIN